MPLLMEETAVKGSKRLPAGVLTISSETRERSSCGATATSRTRPLAAPDASYTVEPNNSLNETVAISKRIPKSVWGCQMNEQYQNKNAAHRIRRMGIPDYQSLMSPL